MEEKLVSGSFEFVLFLLAGPGPGAVRGQPINVNAPGSPQSAENMQQMKKLMEQELKGDKFKSNSNKGYVFTLMPLYAIGVGVFAAYKFLKVRQRRCRNHEDVTALNICSWCATADAFADALNVLFPPFFLLVDQVCRRPGTKGQIYKRSQEVSGSRCVCVCFKMTICIHLVLIFTYHMQLGPLGLCGCLFLCRESVE